MNILRHEYLCMWFSFFRTRSKILRSLSVHIQSFKSYYQIYYPKWMILIYILTNSVNNVYFLIPLPLFYFIKVLKTQRDRVEREVGGGIGMGNTCKSMADSCHCMTKTTTIL